MIEQASHYQFPASRPQISWSSGSRRTFLLSLPIEWTPASSTWPSWGWGICHGGFWRSRERSIQQTTSSFPHSWSTKKRIYWRRRRAPSLFCKPWWSTKFPTSSCGSQPMSSATSQRSGWMVYQVLALPGTRDGGGDAGLPSQLWNQICTLDSSPLDKDTHSLYFSNVIYKRKIKSQKARDLLRDLNWINTHFLSYWWFQEAGKRLRTAPLWCCFKKGWSATEASKITLHSRLWSLGSHRVGRINRT